jgi:hypothetical protein
MSSSNFKVGRIINALRQSIGDAEFGYRAQGFLAHVFIRLGGRIIDIKSQGHPDITGSFGGKILLLQVKAVYARSRRRAFAVEAEDLEGICPHDRTSVGYLAILDCAQPISWALVDYERLRRQALGAISLVTLHAMADGRLSYECTEEFVKLIESHQSTLRNLDFHILCSRALKGEAL